MALKSTIKNNIASLLHNFGLLNLWSQVTSRRLTIITFHRICTDAEKNQSPNSPMITSIDQFQSILEIVQKHCTPIRLSDAIHHINSKTPFAPRSVVITFDDGYSDIFTYAFPLLKKANIPFTIFLATGFIGRNDKFLWWDEVEYFFSSQEKIQADKIPVSAEIRDAIAKIDRKNHTFTEDVKKFIRSTLYSVNEKERALLISWMREKRGFQYKQIMLTWEQVQQMNQSGIADFGAHTENHPFLNTLKSEDIIREIKNSKMAIEEHTRAQCISFAYPAGFYTESAVDAVRYCGIKCAVSTRVGNNSQKSNLLTLNRKDSGYFYSEATINLPFFLMTLRR